MDECVKIMSVEKCENEKLKADQLPCVEDERKWIEVLDVPCWRSRVLVYIDGSLIVGLHQHAD